MEVYQGSIRPPDDREIAAGVFLPVLRLEDADENPVILMCTKSNFLGLESLGRFVSVQGNCLFIKELNMTFLEVESITFLRDDQQDPQELLSITSGGTIGALEAISSVQLLNNIGLTGTFRDIFSLHPSTSL